MSLLTKYLLFKYIKNFIIVLISLEVFFVGIDLLQNIKDLPPSANLQILYVLYNAFFTLTITLPLSIVFAWIITIVVLIRNNELVAFLALGINKKYIYRPIIVLSTLLTLILMALQATPLAYSYEEKTKIKEGEYFISFQEDVFLKYNNSFVYFKKLYPLKKYATNVHIYRIEDKDILEVIIAKKAFFQNNRWYVVDAKIIQKAKEMKWKESKLEVKHEQFLYTLEGFKPKILDTVYEAKSNFSILDAISSLILLSSQDVNTEKIRAALYYEVFVPFFVLPIMMIIFAYSSLNSRFFNIGKFTSLSVLSTLLIWGMFFVLFKLSSGGVMIPEFSLLLSLVIWYIVSYFIYQNKVRHDG